MTCGEIYTGTFIHQISIRAYGVHSCRYWGHNSKLKQWYAVHGAHKPLGEDEYKQIRHIVLSDTVMNKHRAGKGWGCLRRVLARRWVNQGLAKDSPRRASEVRSKLCIYLWRGFTHSNFLFLLGPMVLFFLFVCLKKALKINEHVPIDTYYFDFTNCMQITQVIYTRDPIKCQE